MTQALARSLSLTQLIFYGVGTIVEAGIYTIIVSDQPRHLVNRSADGDDGVHQRTRWTPWKTRIEVHDAITRWS